MITAKQIERLHPPRPRAHRQFLHYETTLGCQVFEPSTNPTDDDGRGPHVWATRIDGDAVMRVSIHVDSWHLAIKCPKEEAHGKSSRRKTR